MSLRSDEYTTDDEGFEEDMAALARVCMITTTPANEIHPEDPLLAAGDTDSDSDDEWSDMECVKRVQNLTATMTKTTTTMITDSDSDDSEDDFENARAIFKRFSNKIEGNPEGEMETLTKGDQEDIANSSLSSKSDAASESCPVSQHPNTTNLVTGDIKTQHGDFVDSYEPDAGAESCPVPQNPDTTNSVTSSIEKQLSDFVYSYEPDAGESFNLPQRRSSLPPAVHALVDAIKKNRALQKFHRNKLIMLEAKIQESKQIRDKVKVLRDFHSSYSRRTGSALSLNLDPRVQLILARKSPPPDNTKQNDASQGQVRKPEDAINLIGDDDDMILACLVRNKSKKNSQAAKGGSSSSSSKPTIIADGSGPTNINEEEDDDLLASFLQNKKKRQGKGPNISKGK